MNWQEALEEIYSVEFCVSLNVVSGTNSYFRAVAQHPIVKEAYRQMINKAGELGEAALDRIYTLANAEVDPQFENPNDTPLAVLLWLTNFAAPHNVKLAATYVDQAPDCWYAKRLAQRILHPPPSATANYTVPPDPHRVRITRSSLESTRLPAPLMLDPLRVFNGDNSQPGSSVVVDTTWSRSSGIVAVERRGES